MVAVNQNMGSPAPKQTTIFQGICRIKPYCCTRSPQTPGTLSCLASNSSEPSNSWYHYLSACNGSITHTHVDCVTEEGHAGDRGGGGPCQCLCSSIVVYLKGKLGRRLVADASCGVHNMIWVLACRTVLGVCPVARRTVSDRGTCYIILAFLRDGIFSRRRDFPVWEGRYGSGLSRIII